MMIINLLNLKPLMNQFCWFTIKEAFYIKKRTKNQSIQVESAWLDDNDGDLMLGWEPSDGRTMFMLEYPEWLKKVNKDE